ncbi:hypothetical protein ALC60_11865 [Trachymyrmex zeteki]|uniref:Uncharacterized protein n=1 Tax=Mycetomoellerius zeteki TaxID=64791 RepID=A0A151WMI6_9HYME|nr:hypothetical protein ALC60_11865 [Trachymyrmex zeteki]
MSGRTVGRVSGYPVWQQTPVLSRSVARRLRGERKRERGGKGRRERYKRSLVSVAATYFYGKSKFLCSSGRRALGQTSRLDPTADASLFRRVLRA